MRTLTEALAELAESGWPRTSDKADVEAMDRVEHRGGKIQSWRNTDPDGFRRFERKEQTS